MSALKNWPSPSSFGLLIIRLTTRWECRRKKLRCCVEESWERWPERGGAAAARTRTPRREEEESEPFKITNDHQRDQQRRRGQRRLHFRALSGSLKGEYSSSSAGKEEHSPNSEKGEENGRENSAAKKRVGLDYSMFSMYYLDLFENQIQLVLPFPAPRRRQLRRPPVRPSAHLTTLFFSARSASSAL